METKDRIRERRVALGLSQQALANRINVTSKSVSNWEGGHKHPRDKVLQLSQALGVSADWLLGSDDTTPPADGLDTEGAINGRVVANVTRETVYEGDSPEAWIRRLTVRQARAVYPLLTGLMRDLPAETAAWQALDKLSRAIGRIGAAEDREARVGREPRFQDDHADSAPVEAKGARQGGKSRGAS